MTRRPILARLGRSVLAEFTARVLVLTALSWSLPFDAALARREGSRSEVRRDGAAATQSTHTATAEHAAAAAAPPQGGARAQAAGDTLYVNASPAAACNGETPCFTSIQRAIDAVAAGGRVVIQAGEYVEQLDVARKNARSDATEADRIVIEADPRAPLGSVVLKGRSTAACEGGYAVEFQRSRYVTLRGLSIVGAGVRGIGLRGGSRENVGIHLEGLRLARGGPRECNGGIDVGRGNPETVIANNLIYGNGRNGIRFRDGRGGSYYVVGNTIVRNAWSGIHVTYAAIVEITNNVIVANGQAPGAPAARVGIRRLRSSPPRPEQVRLLGNLVCGNVGGELSGPMLDGADERNLTPTGGEGQGVAAHATCGVVAALFADLDGADGQLDTADDDFTLAPASPAVDAGVDPRTLGFPVPASVLESDFAGAAARPRDGDADQVAEFDAGALETPGDEQPTPAPSATVPASPSPSPSATPAPTASPSPSPGSSTPAPTETPGPTPSEAPTPSPEPSEAPTPSPEPTHSPEPVPCLACDACDTGRPGICSAGRSFCDGPFAEPECRTTIEPRTESCGNRIDEDCDGEVDEGGVPEELPTTPAQTGVFVEPLGTTIKFFNQGSAIGLAQGDFNQDGVVDIATAEDANVQNGRRVSVTFGNGDGTFSEPTYLSLPPQHVIPQSVLAHDFDRDGPLDLLVAMRELNEVYFYRGDGSGGFAAPVPSSVGGQAHQIQTADLNCDGILDVATIVDATHVTVGFGNGDGTFAPTTSYLFNNNLVDLALTDVNGDGHPDLVTGSHEYAPLTGIGVRLNDGAGQFGDLKHTAGYSLPDQFGNRGHTQVFGIQIADFDGDTVPDAVASTQGPTGCFMFMKGNGDGTFTPPDYYDGLADRDPSWTCAGSGNLMRRYTENVAPDVDADGKPDVLFYWDENRVLVGISRGDGTFEARSFAASAGSGFPGSQTYQRADGSGMLAAIVADLNGDCMLDLVTNHRQTNGAHGRQGVLLARAPGDFHAPRIAPLLRDPAGDNGHQMERGVVTGDFNNDGNPDFAAGVGRAFFTVGGAGIGIDIWKGHGDGRGEALPFTLNNYAGTGTSYLRTADFDQDGFLDFVFQGGDGPFGRRQSVSTVFGAGDFTFGDRQSAYSPQLDADLVNIRNMIVADLDGDDDPDVVALYDNGGWNKWFATFSNTRTRAPLQFVQEVEVGQGSNGRGIVAADFDGDDIPDLVAQDSGFANPQRVRLFKGNGDLTFQPGVSIFEWTNQGAASAEDFAAADLDEDGDQDLVMAQYFHPCAYVFLGHDDGTFDAPVCYPFWTSRTNRLAIDDFDVDGTLDIVAGVEDGGLMFLRGRGDGTFETTQMYAVGRANTEVVNVADFDRDGRPDLLWSYNDGNFGHSIVLSNATGAVPTPTPGPTLPPGVTHTPPPTPTPTPTPRPTGTPPENLASIVVEPADPIILAGTTQPFTATGILDDGTGVDLTAAVAWSSATPAVASIAATGVATGVSGGTSLITAAIGSFSATTTLTVGARVPGDGVDPVAAITSPVAHAEVTQPVDVVGTATDANFLEYELAIAPAGETSFTRIGGGATPVANGVLGRLDPTLLINDQYTLRLTVFDRGGNDTTATIVVQVAREMKVGHFTLAFVDVDLPLSGIPLGVTRSYDSRDKRQGDFGIGWRLDVQSIRVRPNRVLGTGWVRGQAGPTIFLSPTDAHLVSVTLPGGQIQAFDMVLSPTSNFGSLDATTVTGFTPRAGSVGRLEALDNPNLLIFNAGLEDELVDDLTFATYDPQLFRYTTVDGTRIEVHRTLGVQKIVDASGNTLTFGPGGLVHSSGGALTFTRDAQSRITQIVDPTGRTNAYGYDATGDLTTHVDAAGNTTHFLYDRHHNLLRIVDPLGRTVSRNDYDDDGRLVATTDAAGKRTEIEHDLAGRREIMTDRLGRTTTLVYDEVGNVLSSTDALGETSTFTYDAQGNRLTATDPLGRTTTRTYDANRNETSVTDPMGHTTARTFDANGHPLTVTDALGRTTTLTYDGGGRPLTKTNDLGESTTYAHDAGGNLTAVTDALGRTLQNQYDGAGRRTKIVQPDGSATVLSNHPSGTIATQLDAGGLTQSLAYDARNLLTSISGAGLTRSVGYDAGGQATSVTTASGDLVHFDYDALGQPIRVRRQDGTVAKTLVYDAEGNLTSESAPTGGVHQYAYDAANRLIRTTSPDGATEEREYDGAGQLIALTDALGHTTHYAYDGAGRLIQTTDALGGVATQAYDAVGNLIAETDPLGRTTQYAYDDANRLVTTTFADGKTETRSYDAAGQLIEIVDAAGHSRSRDYDAAGRLVAVTDELGHVTALEYDVAGRTRTTIDANGRRTTEAYDLYGRRLATTQPGGETETATYDPAGRVLTKTNGNGETLAYSYGASALPTVLTYPGGATETVSYAADGLVEQVVDARGTTVFEYDPLTRRLRKVTEPDGRYVRYAYDLVGRRTLVAHAMGAAGPEQVTEYDYDALGRLVEVRDPDGGTTRYGYDAASQQTTTERANGTLTEQTFDARGRVTSIVHRDPMGGVLQSFGYTLDALGRRTKETRGDGSRVEYAYDAAGRMIEERRFAPGDIAIGTTTFTYDAVGNLTSRTSGLGTATFTYNANDQLLSGDGVSYAYDAAGNQTSASTGPGQVTTFTYDAKGRLVRIEPPGAAATAYTYDAEGNRQRSDGPLGTTDFLVDRASPTGLSEVLRESDGGSTVRSHVLGLDRLSENTGGALSYRHADGLGSTRLLSDGAGGATDTYEYEPYGSLRDHAGSSDQPYRFAGERQDEESGLYHLRARYYDPRTGRFLSRDPAAGDATNPRSLHDYGYAQADPVNLSDPSGRSVPTTLVELLAVFKAQLIPRVEQFKAFVRGERKVADTTGDIAQRVGAGLAILALAEEVSNPANVRLFFGNLVPGYNTFQAPIEAGLTAFGLGGLGELGVGLFTLVASGRLVQTTGWMLTKNVLYKVEDLTACAATYKAVVVTPVPPLERYVELCPPFFKLEPIPTGKEAVLGGFDDASMAGVMVHEWTHLVFHARDDEYLCRNVQKLLAHTAVNNADSYRCWVEYAWIGIDDSLLERVFGEK